MIAQLLREMLTPSTFESFRAFSLGTLARIDEAIELIDDAARERIPRAAMDPAIAELVWSLGKDPVARDVAQAEREAVRTLVKQSDYQLNDLRAHLF
jgi:hypothetical protein